MSKKKVKEIYEDEEYPVFEFIIDEENDLSLSRVSLVDQPAIGMKGLYFSAEGGQMQFFKDNEKKLVVGPAMIPDKKILRKTDDGKIYRGYFTKETIKKMVDIFNKNLGKKPSGVINDEHTNRMVDAYVVGSWIIEDNMYDKSRFYGFDLPVGTWFLEVKVDDEDFWENEVKGGKYGFSIEGLMGIKPTKFEEMVIEKEEGESKDDFISRCIEIEVASGMEQDQAVAICISKGDELFRDEIFEDSFTDYPEAAKENAKIALRWVEKNGWGSCGTPVGKVRANQLANGEPISRDTIARMAAFERHRRNSDKELGDGCGRLMWLAWGGDEGVDWAKRKLESLKKEENFEWLEVLEELGWLEIDDDFKKMLKANKFL